MRRKEEGYQRGTFVKTTGKNEKRNAKRIEYPSVGGVIYNEMRTFKNSDGQIV
jgi:hypothetical protein